MEELDEFGIPIKKISTPQSEKVEMDEFGIPVKKKEPSNNFYEVTSEAIGIKPKQLSQSPLKTAETTIPSVSTKSAEIKLQPLNIEQIKAATTKSTADIGKPDVPKQVIPKTDIKADQGSIADLSIKKQKYTDDLNLANQEYLRLEQEYAPIMEELDVLGKEYEATQDPELAKQYNNLYLRAKPALDKMKMFSENEKILSAGLRNVEQMQDANYEKNYGVRSMVKRGFGNTVANIVNSTGKIIETFGDLAAQNSFAAAYAPEALAQEDVKLTDQLARDIDEYYKRINEAVNREVPKSFASYSPLSDKPSAAKLLDFGINAFSQLAPTVVAGLTTGGVGAAAMGFTMEFGSVYDTFHDPIKQRYIKQGLSEKEAEVKADLEAGLMSTGVATIIGQLDKFGATEMINAVSKKALAKKITQDALVELGEKTGKEAAETAIKKSLVQNLAAFGKGYGKTVLPEATTEPIQELVAPATADVYEALTGEDVFEEGLGDKQTWINAGNAAVGALMASSPMGVISGASGITTQGYKKAVSMKDPAEFDKFNAILTAEVESGITTPEQAQEAIEVIKKVQAADKQIPSTIQSEVERTTAANLLIEKQNITAEIEGKDAALVAPQKERIKEIDAALSDIASGNFIKELETTEETDGEGTIEGAVSTGTDVAEEGLGVATEPSSEGITGEGVQTETVPQAPVTAEEIETRRQETEDKIKRKDLFIGVGEFSTELGGSDLAAVPFSHKEKNGIEFVEYAHPKTGSVDVIVTGKSDNDFVGFYRIYENGKPTNKWSSKFENQSRNKEDFKTMISGVQEMLPAGHEYTEKTSISTDGLRVWNQQLERGYELQYDENGKLITNSVFINGDAIVNELGIPVDKGNFDRIRVTTREDFEKVKAKLLPYLEKFGLDESSIKWISGNAEITPQNEKAFASTASVKIDLPVLKNNKVAEVVSKKVTEVTAPAIEVTPTAEKTVTAPKVSEALKDVESTSKALEGVDIKKAGVIDYNAKRLSLEEREKEDKPIIKDNSPLGTLAKNDMGDAYELQLVDLKSLTPSETGQKLDLVEKYINWKKQGNDFPPITAIRKSDGTLIIVDGHNRYRAAKLNGDKNIRVWVSLNEGNAPKSIDKAISEAYHKAKADGSNPELVAAVEQLLGKPTAEAKTTEAAKTEPVKEVPKQEIKGGVTELFNAIPELSNIGSTQQYSDYLDTVFPDSQVKDIVYHGSKTKKPTDIFVETFIGKNNKLLGAGKGFYFTKDANYSKVYGETTSSIIDIKNPTDFNSSEYDTAQELEAAVKGLSNKGDGVIDSRENFYYPKGEEKVKLSTSPDYIVFKPEQIHILGSKQDIDGFKNFTSQNTETVKEVAKPTKAERKAIAEAKIDDLAAKAKEFLRNKNLPEGTQVSGVSQNKVIDLMASTVKALVNSGIEISEAIKQVREFFEQDYDTSAVKDYEIAQAIARDELTDVAKENGFTSYKHALNAVSKYVREVGEEDVITEDEIIKAKEAKDKEAEAPKKGYTSKKKKAQAGEKESVEDKTGTRAFAAKAMGRAGVPISEIPVNLRNYTTTNVEEQTKIAEEFIAKYGIDNTIQLLKQKDASIDPRNKPVLASVLLNALYAEQGKTTDAAILKKIANDVYDVIDATLTAATNAAQFMSFMREFYNSNPYNFVAQVTRLIEKNINQPIETKISDAVVEINEENKKAAGKAASNVVKNIVSPKATAAREQYNKSKANLKSIWNKGLKVGISANQYENAKNDVQFVKALSVMAKDFVVYQSVQFSEFLKEVATELGLKESDIDQDHLKVIFEKAKSEKITSGIKVGLKELELKLKDLIEEHYTSAETIEDKLVDKLVKQFGLSEKDAKEVEKAVRYEIKVLTAKQKIKALKAAGIKDKTYINELLVLSEAGLLDTQSIIEEFGKKLGMKELTKEEMDKLVALAQAVADSKEDRVKARNVQKFEDYKFVLSKQYKISDFLVSNYLTNIFGSLGANLKNIVGNVSETMLLTSELMGNALVSGNPKEMLAAARALADGTARGFDFTKEVLAKGTASYKELSQIRPRGMWELIMDRDVNLTRIERTLQFLFKIPYLGPASLAERRFWNRALLSMDSLSGTTNNELGSLLAATKEANKQGLKGKERANFIAEQMANSPEAISEAKAYAISLGYKEGTKAFRMAYKNYLVSKRPEAIKKAAAEYSGRATLTQEPPVHTLTGFVADTINNAISKNQKLKFIFPVVNTFANLIIKNIERSPFEFFSLGLDVVRAGTDAKVKEALTQEEIARRIKTATVWTAIAVLLFMAAGGMGDDEEEGFEIYGSGTGNKQIDAIRRATGWKPNSIRFGKDGGYWSFEFLPFGFLLSMVGNMRDYFKYNDETGLAVKKAQSKRLFGKTYDSLTETEKMKLESELMTGKYNYSELKKKELANLSWNVVKTPATYTAQLFKSLGDVIGVLSEQSRFQNIKSILGNIGRGVASPRYMGEVRDITDNKLYDSKEFFNMLGSNVPFVTLGNVRLDAFGRDVEKYKKETILSGVKYAFQRGFYNPSKGTPLDQFLWENKIGIGIPDDTATLALPEDAYREFIVTRGKILMDDLSKALEDKSLTERKSISGKIIELTPDEIVKRINKYVTKATEEARKDIDKKLGRNNKIE